MAKANLAALLTNLKEFRKKQLVLLEDKKITAEEFSHSNYGFITKTHIHSVTKANSREQVLINYYYWLSFVERKIVLEEHLIAQDLGSTDLLLQAVRLYIKRRDKMIFRLISELKERPKSMYYLSDNVVEIVLQDDTILYASKEIIEEMKEDVRDKKTSPNNQTYLNKFILPY
jgi:hypothetical protein